MNKFGIRLKELRKSKNLTQFQLSKALHIGRSSISHYEKGQQAPELEVLKNLSKYFEVTIDYLLGLTDLNHYESEYGDYYAPIQVEDNDIYIPDISEDEGLYMEEVENCSHYDGITDVNYYPKEIDNENDLLSDEMRDYLEKSVYIKEIKKNIKHLDQLDKLSLKIIDALLVKLLDNDK
nr:helix-turn-helix transcriptional regulator [Clostridioides sp.]